MISEVGPIKPQSQDVSSNMSIQGKTLSPYRVPTNHSSPRYRLGGCFLSNANAAPRRTTSMGSINLRELFDFSAAAQPEAISASSPMNILQSAVSDDENHPESWYPKSWWCTAKPWDVIPGCKSQWNEEARVEFRKYQTARRRSHSSTPNKTAVRVVGRNIVRQHA